MSSFQASFGPPYRVGWNLTYFLPKKRIFCTFWPTLWLLTSRSSCGNPMDWCRTVWSCLGDLLFYLWASGCSFWLSSLRQKSRYMVKKCPKLALKLNTFFIVLWKLIVVTITFLVDTLTTMSIEICQKIIHNWTKFFCLMVKTDNLISIAKKQKGRKS